MIILILFLYFIQFFFYFKGVGNIRWQGCRRAAMETVLRYWESTHPDSKEQKAFVTVAGLEPLEFTNLFDIWQDRDDIAEINIAVCTSFFCNVFQTII